MLGPGDLFSVEVHHGGLFVGYGENRSYIDEKVNCFDHCDIDIWSPLWFDDFVGQLSYKKSICLKVYWLLPGKTLADGLRIIVNTYPWTIMTDKQIVKQYKRCCVVVKYIKLLI